MNGRHPSQALPRLLAPGAGPHLDAHLDKWGPIAAAPGRLIDDIEVAGLRGRGGAGFPTGVKLRAAASGRHPVVVANGTEGEPVSSKDRVLLGAAPHLVLDGLAAVADAVGADEAFICVDRQSTAALGAVTQAVVERRRVGVDRTEVQLAATPSRYITGEESALVHWLNGGDARPTTTPPPVYERGFDRRPTLVQNVETLAHVGLIARFGSEWFRGLGPPTDPGSALLTIRGAVARPGVVEAAFGTTMIDVVAAAGGTLSDSGGVLLGGYFGTWIPADTFAGCVLTRDDLRRAGGAIGCGALVVLPASACGLAETARIVWWFAGQSAQQCGPCTNGLPAIAGALDQLVSGDRAGRSQAQLERWLAMVDGRGACHLPDGVVRLVRSALSTFAGDIDRHRRRGPCPTAAPVLPTPRPDQWR